jgi:hypothetical protein
LLPPRRIIEDVLAGTREFVFVAEDPFVIVALPDQPTWDTQKISYTAGAVRLERTDERPKRIGHNHDARA